MGLPGGTELLVIFGIVLLVFGAGKLPKIARDLGSGIQEFKRSMSSDSLSYDEPKKGSDSSSDRDKSESSGSKDNNSSGGSA